MKKAHQAQRQDRRKQGNSMDTNLLHYELSVEVALAIKAEPLRCWKNAALAVLTFPRLFALGTYDEGWIVVPRNQVIAIIEHGWCTSPEIGIVDPSIVLIESREQPVTYFSGLEIPGGKLHQYISGKTIPLVCNSHYGRDGMRHKGYKQSYDKAWQWAQKLAQERQLPQNAIKVSTRDGKRGLTLIKRF